MVDYYSQRLNQARQEKEASINKMFLPFQKPETRTGAGTEGSNVMGMAGKPADPNAQNQLQDSPFKTAFDEYATDDSFKTGMEEFATIMEAMKKDLNGINLPPEVMQKKVEQVIQRYTDTASKKNMMMNMQGAMGQSAPEQAPMPVQPTEGAMING